MAVTYRDGNQPVVGVSYAGRSLNRLRGQNAPGNQNRIELWYLVAPAVGTASVAVTLTNARAVVAGAVSFIGVDQTTPFGTLATAANQISSACATLSGGPAPLAALFVGANGDADAITTPGSQTTAWNRNTGTAGGDIQSTGVTTTLTSSAMCQALAKAKPWSMMAVPLNAALML